MALLHFLIKNLESIGGLRNTTTMVAGNFRLTFMAYKDKLI
jgi:hypothetical protein